MMKIKEETCMSRRSALAVDIHTNVYGMALLQFQ